MGATIRHFAGSEDQGETAQNVSSDLLLHCPIRLIYFSPEETFK